MTEAICKQKTVHSYPFSDIMKWYILMAVTIDEIILYFNDISSAYNKMCVVPMMCNYLGGGGGGGVSVLDFGGSPCCCSATLDELCDTRHRLAKLILRISYMQC